MDRGGLDASGGPRVERNNRLIGTKRRVASERDLLVARGRSDGRTVILVPEVKGGEPPASTLVHVRFHEFLPAEVRCGKARGYDRRYDRPVDCPRPRAPSRTHRSPRCPSSTPLITPISEIADRWRS
ncbi:MAG: hypothetical protein R2715_23575 [Ilumatobacteraceae bacterium]